MTLTEVGQPKDAEFEALKAGLNGFNESVTGVLFREKVSSFAVTDSGQIVGGILGEIKWGWLHVEGLWVDDRVRGEGWGRKLLARLEEYALQHNVNRFRLETTSFQALDFYLKQNYKVFGELPDMPPGHTSYFLMKQHII